MLGKISMFLCLMVNIMIINRYILENEIIIPYLRLAEKNRML